MTTSLIARRGSEVLLCPGPVMLSPAVRAALGDCQIGHRDARFSQLMQHLRANCRQVFRSGDEHSILFIGGPATSSIEAVCSSLLPRDAHVLVPVNGTFGARIAAILEVHGIAHTVIDCGFAQPFDLERIEAAIADPSRGRITAIAMTHHETSAGLLNPVRAIGAMTRRHGLAFIVDATSSAGVEDLDVTRDGIDACITASGKCLHAPPGVGLVCVRRDLLEARALDRAAHVLARPAAVPRADGVQRPDAFHASRALDRRARPGDRGTDCRGRSRRTPPCLRAATCAAGNRSAPRGPVAAAAAAGSEAQCILTVRVPDSIAFDALYAEMKQRGYLIYGCKAPLAPNHFQVAVMGELRDTDLAGFLDALVSALAAEPGRYQAASA